MRPVEKGASPRAYQQYKDAQPDLVNCIGDYCSYCERQIETNLAVEHIQPKSRKAALKNSWDNFLLGCVNCNSCKGKKNVSLTDYFFPDTDNTFMAFEYTEDGRVEIKPGLSTNNQTRAQNTISLVGLDREPGHPNRRKRPTHTDRRWRKRMEVWQIAQDNLQKLSECDNEIVRDLIVQSAKSRGMFSIWMKVFESDNDMRCRIIQAFTGTSAICFDINGNAVNRPGGKI